MGEQNDVYVWIMLHYPHKPSRGTAAGFCEFRLGDLTLRMDANDFFAPHFAGGGLGPLPASVAIGSAALSSPFVSVLELVCLRLELPCFLLSPVFLSGAAFLFLSPIASSSTAFFSGFDWEAANSANFAFVAAVVSAFSQPRRLRGSGDGLTMFNCSAALGMRLAPAGRGEDLALTLVGFFFGAGLFDLDPSLGLSPDFVGPFFDSFFVSAFLRTGILLEFGFAGRAACAASAAHVLLEGDFDEDAVAVSDVVVADLSDFRRCPSPYIIES